VSPAAGPHGAEPDEPPPSPTEAAEDRSWGVKTRARDGGTVRKFLTPAGSLTRLRVHAALMTKRHAEDAVARLGADNPGYDFWAVPLFPRRKEARGG
jgi:hypothetical protein